MKRLTPKELVDLAEQIATKEGLWLPMPSAKSTRPIGPSLHVYLRYPDLFPHDRDIEKQYWKALRRAPVPNALGVLGNINRNLVEYQAHDLNVHRRINQGLLSGELKSMVDHYQFRFGGRGFAAVFTRIGCLLLMRHLMLYGNRSIVLAGQKEEKLGELALLGNTFVQFDPITDPAHQSTLDFLLFSLPRWDIDNPLDLAYSLSRMFTILTEILPGQDPEVQRLVSHLGMDVSGIRIDNLPLNDFVSAVFGVFASGREMTPQNTSQFDVRQIFSRVGFPPRILRKLIKARALTISRFKKLLGGDTPRTYSSFFGELRRRQFLVESLNCFRQFPMLKLDRYRVIMLDLQFIVELLTSGVYWSIFDGLPINKRDMFRELWGHLFEVYAVGLLKDSYPAISGLLMADIRHAEGQIDALLDFGSSVLVFEIKASLLTEAAKRGGNKSDFLKDFNRKFIRNEKGKPKVVPQLATSCKAIEEGRIATSSRLWKQSAAPRIYPILVSDERAVEAFFFNTYLNEIFQSELSAGTAIRPITAMSIGEFEEILPYVSGNIFSWEELLQRRFNQAQVNAFSVHQTIFDLLQSKGMQPQRNESLSKKYDEIGRIISSRYKQPAT